MVDVARFREDKACLPPPRKILRQGTAELEDALENGEVELSLPQHELSSWMGNVRGWKCSTVANDGSKPAKLQDSASKSSCTRTSCSKTAGQQTMNGGGNEETVHQDLQVEKPKQKAAVTTKFRDIIGHGHVKLRLEEVLLPLALPQPLADAILTGT